MFLILFSCFPGARLDLSAEDKVVALALAECPARPYGKLIKSDIPGPSNLRSTRSTALRLSRPRSRSDPIGESEPVSGCETIYWDSLIFFFKADLISVVYK